MHIFTSGAGRESRTRGYLLIAGAFKVKAKLELSALNVTVIEHLRNRAITKMASAQLMLGHSEDSVSVCPMAWCTLYPLSSHIISLLPRQSFHCLGVHLAKRATTALCF